MATSLLPAGWYVQRFIFAFLLGSASFAFANAYCPESVPAKMGYLTFGGGFNISPCYGYYSQSVAELARHIETVTEAEHPGWDLVLNSPIDGSKALKTGSPEICFKLYINALYMTKFLYDFTF